MLSVAIIIKSVGEPLTHHLYHSCLDTCPRGDYYKSEGNAEHPKYHTNLLIHVLIILNPSINQSINQQFPHTR